MFQVDSLTANQTYYFFVTAYNTANLESLPSNVVAYTPTDSTPAPTLIAIPDSLAVTEDGSGSLVLQAQTSGDAAFRSALSFRVTTQPSHGSLIGSCPNLTYQPHPNFAGSDSFAFDVSNGSLTSAPGLISITVSAVNDRPVASPASASVVAGVPINIPLQAADVENSPLTFSITQGPSGGSLTGSGSTRTYVARKDFSGLDSFDFTASDGLTTSLAARVTIDVKPAPNTAPVALAQSQSLAEDSTLPVTLTATDVDGNTLTYTITKLPANGVLIGSAPSVSYKPNTNFFGTDSFEFTAHDGKVASSAAVVSLSITSVNDRPVASPTSTSVVAGVPIDILLQAVDVETQLLTFNVTQGPSGGSITGSGATRTYVARKDFSGSDSFDFTASDGLATSLAARVTIEVKPAPNTAPVALAQSQSLAEDSTLPVTLTATDVDGNTLTYTITKLPANGVLIGAAPSVSYKPNTNFFGTDSFEFTAHDGKVASSAAVVSLSITSVNDRPIASPTSTSVVAGVPIDILLQGVDVETQLLTFNVTQGPSGGSITGSGATRTYIARKDFSGMDSFDFTASDGLATSLAARVTIDVKPAPNTPPVAIAQARSLAEDSTLPVTLTATDVDGNTLTYTITKLPANGVLIGSAPSVSYKPAANFFGSDSFEFTAHDGKVASSAAVISLNITPVNDVPVPVSLTVETTEDASASITLVATDADDDSISFTVTTPPTLGRLIGTPPGLQYIPNTNANGTDSFRYRASDGSQSSQDATVTIVILPENDLPVAMAQSQTLAEDTTHPISLSAIDADGNALTYTVTKLPANGVLLGSAPNVSYKPATDFFGSDSFEFIANDGNGASSAAVVSLTITPANDAPVASPTTVELAEDTTATITLLATDADEDSLSFTVTTPPTLGRLMGTAPRFLYVPNTNASGTDSFQYRASDGTQSCSDVTVTIVIRPENDAPAAASQSVSLNEDLPKLITLVGSDPDLDVLTYVITQKPARGTLLGTAPNLTYVPETNYFGLDSFQFTVSDGKATPAVGTVSIRITALNDKPYPIEKTITLNEDTATAFTLEATDPDDTVLKYLIARQPAYGTLTGTPPSLTYLPKQNFSGSDSIRYIVTDGKTGGSVYANIYFTVAPVNDAPVANSSTVSTTYGTSKSITLSGSDVEKSPLKFAITKSPTRGTLSGTPPSVSYRPLVGFYGTDVFEFTVNDGSLTSAPAKVTVQVGAPTKLAKPQPDVAFVSGSGSTSRLMDGSTSVLANDSIVAAGQVEIRTLPNHGTATLSTNGTFTYRHAGGLETTDSFTYVVITDGVASPESEVHIHIFQLAGLSRDADQVLLSFPVIAGVVYRVEGSAFSSSASWQVLGELTSSEETVAEVPTAALADGTSRYFRITATDANGTLVTEPFGFQRFALEAGARTYTSAFQGMKVLATTVASSSGNTVELATSSLVDGQLTPTGAFASYALIIPGTSQWWPIQGNTSGSLVVAVRESDLSAVLVPGTPVEIVRMPDASQILGSAGTSDSALQPGDFVDFVNGNGSVSTVECRATASGEAAYFIRNQDSIQGPVDSASISFLPGQPIQVQKAGAAGTLWFLGRVQSNPLALYRVGATETNGSVSQ